MGVWDYVEQGVAIAAGAVATYYGGPEAGVAAYKGTMAVEEGIDHAVNDDDSKAGQPSTSGSGASAAAGTQEEQYARLAALLSDKDHISENKDEILKLVLDMLGSQQTTGGTQQTSGSNPNYSAMVTSALSNPQIRDAIFSYFSDGSEAIAA